MNGNRRFLRRVLESGLELGVLTPDDIVTHVGPEVLAHHLPVGLKAKLLAAALAAKEMNAKLVVDTLGVEALAEHAPTPNLWSAAADAMKRSMEAEGAEAGAASSATAAAPAAKVEPEAKKVGVAASEPEAKKAGAAAADAEDDTREGAAKGSAVDRVNGSSNGIGRKPNRMARAGLRARAGATSRRQGGVDDDEFDVDTKVGDGGGTEAADFEIIDEADAFDESSTAVRGDTTSPGLRKR